MRGTAKPPQGRDQVMRCGYPAIAQLTFPCFRPAMPGNGCPGQVDEGVGFLGSGVEDEPAMPPETDRITACACGCSFSDSLEKSWVAPRITRNWPMAHVWKICSQTTASAIQSSRAFATL